MIRAGFSKVDITPDPSQEALYNLGYWYERAVRFTGVRDPIFARCACLIDEPAGRPLFMVSVDSIYDSYGFCASALHTLQERLGLKREELFVACTHTHATPLVGLNNAPDRSDYGAFVASRIVQAASQALASAEPATVVLQSMPVGGVLRNRRVATDDGTVAPLHGNTYHRSHGRGGTVDNRMTLVRFVRPLGGGALGYVCHFGIHGVCLQTGSMISADCMGAAIQEFESLQQVPVLHLIGACGDVDPVDMGSEQCLQSMAGRLLGALRRLSASSGREVAERPIVARVVDCLLRRRSTRSAEELERMRQSLRTDAGHAPRSAHEGPGYELFLLDEESRVSSMGETVEVSIHVVRMGDIVWAGVSGELFARTGMDLRASLAPRTLLPVALVNGWNGYFPPQAEFSRGGYETACARWCPVAPGETERLFAATRMACSAL